MLEKILWLLVLFAARTSSISPLEHVTIQCATSVVFECVCWERKPIVLFAGVICQR